MFQLEILWLVSHDTSLFTRFERLAGTIIHPFEQSVKVTKLAAPGAVIIDPDVYQMSDCIDWITEIMSKRVRPPVMIVSKQNDRDLVFHLLKAGASGYLLKGEDDEILESALCDLVAGHSPLSSQVATHIIDATKHAIPQNGHEFDLNQRDIEILHFLADGLTKKNISEKHQRSVHTVDNQIRRIYRKLDVGNLGAALGKAFRSGIIS